MSNNTITVEGQGSKVLVILPLWLSVMPETWAMDCFELSSSCVISYRWGNA